MNTINKKEGILLQSGNNEVEFIEFKVAEVSYGINVAKVQRVIARPSVKLTRLDNGKTALMGSIYVQDLPIQLIDLRKALHVPPAPEGEGIDEDRQLVLVTEFNKRTSSFLIDSVNKIHRTSWSEFEPLEGTMLGDGMSSYVTGTIKVKDRVVIILDLEHLMMEFLPAKERDSAAEYPVELLERRKQVRLIYAEDSGVIRKMMLKTLSSGGYSNVKSFEHGKAAYDYILELRQLVSVGGGTITDHVDCIITDIEMPQMDGLTLCKSIKEQSDGAAIPAVIVYSSLINEGMAKKCSSVGADAQVSKPHGDEILSVLDQLCLNG